MSLLQQELPISLTCLSDGELASQALDGNQDAFEELVKRYSSPIFHFIAHFLGDYDSACDVLQQVMLRLYTSLPTLHHEHSFKAWLFTVAHNLAIDELRSKHCLRFSELQSLNTEETELSMLVDTAPVPHAQVEYHELQRALQQAIAQLPIHYREVVLLRYLLQMTFAEIGQVLDKPEATVKTYFYRAKHLLRTWLQAERVYELLPES